MQIKNLTMFIFLTFILLLSVGLRLYLISLDQLWMDEAYTAIISSWPMEDIFKEIPGLGSPPLYNILLHFWIEAFGNSVYVLRYFSLCFGIGFILLLFYIGRSWFGTWTGLLAAFIAAINALHIFYSQQARVYAMLMFVSLACMGCLFGALTKHKMRYWLGYIFFSVLLLYSHNWALFLLPIPYVFFLIEPSSRKYFIRTLFAHLIILIFYIPYIPLLLAQASSGSSSWVGYFIARLGSIASFFKSFEIMFMGGEFLTFGKLIYGRIVPVFLLILVLFFAIKPKKDKTHTYVHKMQYSFLLCYLFIPLILPYLFSFYKPIFIPGRYDMIVFGAFALFIAIGFIKMPKNIRIISLALFVFLSAINLYGFYYKRSPRHENENMALLLKEKGGDQDLVVFTGLTRLPIEYYLGNDFQKFQIKHHPSSVENTLGYYDYPKYLANIDKIENETYEWVFNLNSPDKIWVCANRWPNFVFEKKADFLNEPLYLALTTKYQLMRVHPFRKAFILEFNSRK